MFPRIGARPIAELQAPELLTCLRRVEARGALETAHRILQNCGQILRYAIATGRGERNPANDLQGALPPVKEKHLASVTDPKAVASLLRAYDGYEGSFVTLCALRLAPLVFVRPGELRRAEWTEIDLDNAEWNIAAERTKMREPHLVPLSKQAVAILRELHALTGRGRYVFPGARTHGRPMSDNAVLAALRRMGIGKDEMSGHGFRAIARTIMDEVLHVRPDYIEHQPAHATTSGKRSSRRIYRASLLWSSPHKPYLKKDPAASASGRPLAMLGPPSSDTTNCHIEFVDAMPHDRAHYQGVAPTTPFPVTAKANMLNTLRREMPEDEDRNGDRS